MRPLRPLTSQQLCGSKKADSKGSVTMATIFTEGFDKYGPPKQQDIFDNESTPLVANMLVQGEWNFAQQGANTRTAFQIVAGLSETGQALELNGALSASAVFLSKTLPNNYATLVGGIRFQAPDLATDKGFVFVNGSTPLCSLIIRKTSGLIALCQGQDGTEITESLASVTTGTTHYLEWQISFGAGSNTYAAYLDDVPIFSGSGPTGSSNVNVFQIYPSFGGPVTTGSLIVDDLYLFDTSTLFNNAPLNTAPRVATRVGSLDHQTQFTNINNVFGITYPATFVNNTPGANVLALRKFTPNVNSTLNSIGIRPESTNLVANFKGVLYADSGGVPGALISDGSQVTGCVADVDLTLPLVTPSAVTAGTPYWIGWYSDTSLPIIQQDNTTNLGFTAARSYGSGAPNPAPAMTANQPSWVLYGNCTGSVVNWPSVSLNPPFGNKSCIQSSTVGVEDLYGFPTLPADTLAVYTVGVKGHCYLTVTGPRTVSMRMLSSATDSGGSVPSLTPTTAPAWMDSYFDTDPNTSISWTVANCNAAFAGMEIAT